jgi:hypothetical protein
VNQILFWKSEGQWPLEDESYSMVRFQRGMWMKGLEEFLNPPDFEDQSQEGSELSDVLTREMLEMGELENLHSASIKEVDKF